MSPTPLLQPSTAEPVMLRVLRPARCSVCLTGLDVGDVALRDPNRHTLVCVACLEDAEALDPAVPEREQDSVLLLNGCRPPRSGGTIDHLAVTPNGVWVIARVRFEGKLIFTARGGGVDQRLLLNGEDRSTLIADLQDMVDPVRAALEAADAAEVAVRSALCFVGTQVPLIQRSISVRGHLVTWPTALRARLLAPGAVDAEDRAALHGFFERAFPPDPQR